MFHCIQKNTVTPIVSCRKTTHLFTNPSRSGGMQALFSVSVLFCFVLLLTSPLAAGEPGKLTVEPFGSAAWSDHLTFQQDHPQYGKEPKVVPFMPMPEPREVDELTTPPEPVSNVVPKEKTLKKGDLLAASNKDLLSGAADLHNKTPTTKPGTYTTI